MSDDGTTVTPEAYLRRPIDKHGLSVGTTPQAVRESGLKLKGIASLAVNAVRAIVNPATGSSLDVTLDSPTHGHIDTRIPYQGEGDDDSVVAAEFLAGRLAEISTLLPPDRS